MGTAPPLRDPRRALSLTADEHLIVFSRANGTVPARLHCATRPSANEPFGAPVPLPLADPGDESFAPSLSADGSELVWTRGVAGRYEMRISRRLADGTYDAGEAVTVAGVKPEATATRALVPNALYFLEHQGTSEIDGWWLRRAQRLAGGAFAIPTLDFKGAWRAGLAVTSDELALYLTRGSPAEGPWHGGPTEMAHRSSVDLPWGAFLLWPAYTQAGPVVTGADGLQPESSFDARWVSPDDCRVYIYVIDPKGAARVGVLRRYD